VSLPDGMWIYIFDSPDDVISSAYQYTFLCCGEHATHTAEAASDETSVAK
jgi:hypothetical protein